MKSRQRFLETRAAPVENMVVGEHAAVEPGGAETGNVGRMHPVVHALAGPGVVTRRHGGFQVHDSHIGTQALKLGQRVAPNVFEAHGLRQRSAAAFGKRNVLQR